MEQKALLKVISDEALLQELETRYEHFVFGGIHSVQNEEGIEKGKFIYLHKGGFFYKNELIEHLRVDVDEETECLDLEDED